MKNHTIVNQKKSNLLSHIWAHGFLLALLLLNLFCNGQPFTNINQQQILANSSVFIENKGQLADSQGNVLTDVLFNMQLPGMQVYFRTTGLSFVLIQNNTPTNHSSLTNINPMLGMLEDMNSSAFRIDLSWQDGNNSVAVEAQQPVSEYFNYYYSHCPDGITGVKGYEKLVYNNVYDGIDIVFYLKKRNGMLHLEYDIVVHPGADPNQIKLKYNTGTLDLITQQNTLKLQTPLGLFTETMGEVYQLKEDSTPEAINATYVFNNGVATFNVAEYNTSKDLIIDPFFTYYGTSAPDEGKDAATDGNNDVVIVGTSQNIGLPVSGTGYTQNYSGGSRDLFIVKLNSLGARLWSTYYGGDDDFEYAGAVAIDNNNDIYLCGSTASDNFPTSTPGVIQSSVDAFLISLSTDGVRNWASYFGGNGQDVFQDICIDQSQNLVVCGNTSSINIPAAGCFISSYSGGNNFRGDGYVAKFNPAGIFQMGAYLGGSFDDVCLGVTTDNNNDILVTGETQSNDFAPALGGFRAGDWDAFIIKISESCNYEWGYVFGGNGSTSEEKGLTIGVDPNTNGVIVGGETPTSSFPVVNGRNHILGSPSTFFRKYDEDGNVVWSTYYEGNNCNELEVDNAGNIWATGRINRINLNTSQSSYQENYGGGNDDAYVAHINTDGVTTICATYYGGSLDEEAFAIALDNLGNVYITGETRSLNLPGVDGTSIQNTYGGNASDAFIASICSGCNDTPTIDILEASPISICAGEDITLNANSLNPITWTIDIPANYSDTIQNADSTQIVIRDITDTIIVDACVGSGGPGCLVCETVTINVVAAPTATFVTPNVTICPNEPYNMQVNLVGAAPWELEIDGPNGTVIYPNINATPFEFEITKCGEYTIKKVTDIACFSIDQGTATIDCFNLPTATIGLAAGQDNDICPGETVDLEVTLDNGVPLYSFKYTKNGLPAGGSPVNPATNPIHSLAGQGAGTYEIIEVSDANCTQTISESIIITQHPLPTLSITNPEHSNPDNTIWVCKGQNATITFNYTGTGPFVVDSSSTNDGNIGPFSGGSLTVNNPGTYTFHSITDAHCSDAINVSINVAYYPTPTLAFTADPNPICLGTCTDLTFTMAGDGPFDVNFAAPNNGLSFSGQPNGHIINVCPIATTNYNATSITDAHGCVMDLDLTEQVVVHGTLEVINDTVACNNTNDSIQIVITIDGGVTPYNINYIAGPNSGTWDGTGTVWTSKWFAPGAYTLEFYDANDCNRASVNGTHLCNCSTYAGTMNDLSEQALCDGQLTSPTHNGNQTLDGNDVFSYVLSTVAAPTASTDIVLWSNDGIVGFDATTMTCDVTYYLLAIAGNNNAGQVAFDDPCLSMTNAIPVRWRTLPDADFEDADFAVCLGVDTAYNVNLTGCVSSVEYNLDGTWQNATNNSLTVNNNTQLIIKEVRYTDAPLCVQTIDDTLNITALEHISFVSKTDTCNANNDQYVVTVTLSGGDISSYGFDPIIPAGLNWTFDGVDTWTSDPINSSDNYEVHFFDGNNCNTEVVQGQKKCDCSTDAGAMNDLSEQALCEGQLTAPTHDGNQTLDANDVFSYALSVVAVPTTSADIVLWSNNGIVGFDATTMTCDVTYYLLAIAGNDNGGKVAFDDPCLSMTNAIPVRWRTLPDANFEDADFAACIGTNINTNILLSGCTPNFDYTISAPGINRNGVTGVDVQSFVMPASNVALNLTSIQYNNAPTCPQTINKTLNITALEHISFVSKTEICNANNDQYVVTVTLSGGNIGSYDFDSGTVTPAGLNWTFDGVDTWTSDPINSGDNYEVHFFDGNNCNTEVVQGQKTCNCITNAGAVAVNPILICETDQTNITITDSWTGDGNDVFEFVLHNGNGINLGTILDRNTTGVFLKDTLTCDTQYFITGIAGNNDGSGHVDINDPCFSKTAGVEVLWRCNPQVNITVIPNDSICLGDTAELLFNFPAGTAPFNVDAGTDGLLTGLNDGDKQVINPTQTKTYTFIKVSDQYCSNDINESVTITIPDTFAVAANITQMTCHDINDGEITITVSGGFGNYNYQWYNGAGTLLTETSNTLSNLGPDTYNVVITDYLGCSTQKSFTIVPPPLFDIDLVAVLNEICFQDSAGQLRVEAPNGVAYIINDPLNLPWQNDSIFLNMHFIPGTNNYEIQATDVNGCIADTVIDITGLTPITWVNIPQDRYLCPSDETILSGEVTGGNGTYRYIWNSTDTVASYPVSPNESTQYSVHAIDMNGCPSTKQYVTVNVPNPLNAYTTSPAHVCLGEEGILSVFPSGGAGAYQYQWLNIINQETYNQPVWNIIPDTSTNYQIVVTDSCGTEFSKMLRVAVPQPIDVSFTSNINEGCAPLTSTFTNTTSAPYQSRLWNFGNKLTTTSKPTNTWIQQGSYITTLTITDEYGCSYQSSDTIKVYPNAMALFSFFPEKINAALPEVQLRNHSQYADDYIWTIDSVGILFDEEPTVAFPSYESGSYKVCLLANNEYYCPSELCKYIIAENENMVFVPNFFTPNDDGINENFKPVLSSDDVNYYLFMVFDRWGELLFSSSKQQHGWDGTYKNMPVKPDTYTWKLQVRFTGEATIRKHSGIITLGK